MRSKLMENLSRLVPPSGAEFIQRPPEIPLADTPDEEPDPDSRPSMLTRFVRRRGHGDLDNNDSENKKLAMGGRHRRSST
mmetsp:Transcript_13092/g.47784  ORF Transcript_13092/g.47784 Transcript_13092/m.47784 type:complete len:80 (+) Transcript_13092:480-719(+)